MSTDASSATAEDFFVDPVEDAAAEADPARLVQMGMGSNGPLVDRAYAEALPYQYARELVKNGIEAGATYIEVGIDWDQVAASKGSVYRLRYRDNGCGMSEDELEAYFNHISAGSKVLDAHGNFGVGAKISLLPWNHKGVIVMSWQNGDGSMIRLRRVNTLNYGLQKWAVALDDDEGNPETDDQGNPLAMWHKVIDAYDEYTPEWVKSETPSGTGSGTVIVCLGNTGNEDTILGPEGRGTVKQHTLALNTRFFDIPPDVTVVCQELANKSKADWPLRPVPVSASSPNGINNRTVNGARYFLDRFTRPENKGSVQLNGAKAHWWLMDEEVTEKSGRTVVRHNINSFAMATGFIGALYDNELYDVATGTAEARQRYHAFGVIREPVWSKLTIVVEPTKSDDTSGVLGVFPNGARSRLYYSGSATAELPWADWGLEFMRALPGPIREAIDKAAIANQTVDISDKLKALLPRMRQRFYRPSASGPILAAFSRGGDDSSRARRKKKRRGGSAPARPSVAQSGSTAGATENPAGPSRASAFNPRIDVPRIDWVPEGDMTFSNRAAEYVRNAHQILINKDFWLFKQEFEYWASMYQSVQGAQRHVTEVIQEVYGLALGSRVMHAWTLQGKPGWEDDDQFQKLVSPESLTLACLGIAHADAQIAPKIGGRLGAAARGRRSKAS